METCGLDAGTVEGGRGVGGGGDEVVLGGSVAAGSVMASGVCGCTNSPGTRSRLPLTISAVVHLLSSLTADLMPSNAQGSASVH